LADFRIDPANISPPEYAEMAAKPIDEGRLAGYIQELLDELKEMDVAVVVTTGIRYARMSGDLAAMDGMPLHEATLFFERVSSLRSPGSTAAA
jgi:soluble P-type ATPase